MVRLLLRVICHEKTQYSEQEFLTGGEDLSVGSHIVLSGGGGDIEFPRE